ncbi:PDZ domain-containing protein [Brevibacillus humidisoli]|uniref:PDZ domain-containing protein n=1 Tax=Brevibacillus humidisoli TaxID=2895522 RepID=UPI001E4CA736|nr:PDZ domain-containing protein [Brevibacillus humidisoli]UFJ42394.1 PDZ domain-containing protein [Brevibacillus humidisoli]
MIKTTSDRTINITYLEAPLEQVWWSIATPSGSNSYLTDKVETSGAYDQPQVGDRYTLYYGDIVNYATVVACEPHRLFVLSDTYQSMAPDGTIQTFLVKTSYSMEPVGSFVKLTIEVAGFSHDLMGQWLRECLEMGWRRSLMNLKSVLELGLDLRAEMFSYPRMGIANCTVTQEQALQAGVEAGKGNYLMEVFPNSPAAEAGLERGDVIVRIDDTPIGDYASFVRAISRYYGKRAPVRIGYVREGAYRETEANLSIEDRFTGLVDPDILGFEELQAIRRRMAAQRSASGALWERQEGRAADDEA